MSTPMHPMHGLYAAHAARQAEVQKGTERMTSMCLEIADWSHEDCPAGSCPCPCHTPNRESAS